MSDDTPKKDQEDEALGQNGQESEKDMSAPVDGAADDKDASSQLGDNEGSEDETQESSPSMIDKIKHSAHDLLIDFTHEFRPKLIPTVMAVVMVSVLLGLGIWQIQRAVWKTEILQSMDRADKAQPLDLSKTTALRENLSNLDEIAYKTITLTGDWQFFSSLRMVQRTHKDDAGQIHLGTHVITPLVLPDETVVLVNRGWMPEKMSLLHPYQDELDQTVQGIVIPQDPKGRFTPENSARKDFWIWFDVEALAKRIGSPVDRVMPYLLYEVADSPARSKLLTMMKGAPLPRVKAADKDKKVVLTPPQGDYPLIASQPPRPHNRHAMYALTWFSLAIIGFTVWVAASWHVPPPGARRAQKALRRVARKRQKGEIHETTEGDEDDNDIPQHTD